LAVLYDKKKASSLFHPDGIDNVGRFLEYDKRNDQKTCFVQSNTIVYQLHPHWGSQKKINRLLRNIISSTGKSGGCKTSELATEYYKFAADCGYYKAKLNHSRWTGLSANQFIIR
jgi:hypothetical protein